MLAYFFGGDDEEEEVEASKQPSGEGGGGEQLVQMRRHPLLLGLGALGPDGILDVDQYCIFMHPPGHHL